MKLFVISMIVLLNSSITFCQTCEADLSKIIYVMKDIDGGIYDILPTKETKGTVIIDLKERVIEVQFEKGLIRIYIPTLIKSYKNDSSEINEIYEGISTNSTDNFKKSTKGILKLRATNNQNDDHSLIIFDQEGLTILYRANNVKIYTR